nr:LysR family transcriptional regulator [Pseudomonas sp. L-22-4S-12]
MEMKHLRLVRSISQTGNLTRAAEALFISQPALSKQLAELEERLGLALFQRTQKAMLPTEAGLAFDSHAQRILGDVAVLEEHLARYARGDSGRLRLAIDRMHLSDWLPSFLLQLRQRFPLIEVQVKQVPNLLDSLLAHDCDIAILGETSPTSGVDWLALNRDEMVAILPPGHPLGAKPWLEAGDLAGIDLLYHFELEQSFLYRRYLHPQRIELGSLQHIQDIPAIIALVRAGAGISLLPRRQLLGDELGLLVRPIGVEGMVFHWQAAVASDERRPFVRAALQLLQEQLQPAELTAPTSR